MSEGIRVDFRPAGVVVADRGRSSLTLALAVLGLGVATAASAFVRIPLPWTPIPLTLQTFFVLLAGATLGARAGALSQLVGLSVLWASPTLLAAAAPGGLFGPTGGYLLAFAPAAWLAGRMAGGSRLRLTIGLLAGAALILALGALHLVLVIGLSVPAALAAGVLPFVPGDCVKALAVAGIACGLRRR